MICPACGGDSHVVDTRDTAEGEIRRRRKCDQCGARWSTLEVMTTRLGQTVEMTRLVARLRRDADALQREMVNLTAGNGQAANLAIPTGGEKG